MQNHYNLRGALLVIISFCRPLIVFNVPILYGQLDSALDWKKLLSKQDNFSKFSSGFATVITTVVITRTKRNFIAVQGHVHQIHSGVRIIGVSLQHGIVMVTGTVTVEKMSQQTK